MADRFEDLIVWQKARALTKRVYEIIRYGAFERDYRLVAQMRAASVSVMSNIAEGFEKRSKSEFHQGIVIAKGSNGELRSQIYVALDAQYIDAETFASLLGQCEEVSRLMEGLRKQIDRKLRDP